MDYSFETEQSGVVSQIQCIANHNSNTNSKSPPIDVVIADSDGNIAVMNRTKAIYRSKLSAKHINVLTIERYASLVLSPRCLWWCCCCCCCMV